MILIIGASGNVGRFLVPELLKSGASMRILAFDDTPPPAGVPSIRGDTADPASLDPAIDGEDKVFLLSPYSPDLVRNERHVVEAARRAGVGHIVKHSALAADAAAKCTVLRWHGESETHLRESGVPFDIVRPNSFMQNIPSFFGGSIKVGQGIAVAAGEGRVSFVDVADLARTYAAILLGAPGGRVLDVTGPRAVSYRVVARSLSRLLDVPIPYRPLTPSASLDMLRNAGFPTWMGEGFTDYFQFQAEDGCSHVSDVVTKLTHRPAVDLESYLQAERSSFTS